MKIAIACDHAGYIYKDSIKDFLTESGHEVLDFGTSSYDSADYPDFAHKAADALDQQGAEMAILICGSGNGVNMVANKYKRVRAALCWNSEIAYLARTHNDANAIAIPARFVSEYQAIEMVKIFLQTAFEGGRHSRRVNKIPIC
jgi:ribose 5-phosphate isomerase B